MAPLANPAAGPILLRSFPRGERVRRILVALLAICGLVAISAASPAMAACHDEASATAPLLILKIASPDSGPLALVAGVEAVRAQFRSAPAGKNAPCHTGSCCEAGCSHLAVSSVIDANFNIETRHAHFAGLFQSLAGFPPPLADRPPRS